MDLQTIGMSAACLLAAVGQRSIVRASECGVTEYGWTTSGGADAHDAALGGAIVDDGSVFIAGVVHGRVDFDPTKKKDIKRTRKGTADIFLNKFAPAGSYQWTILLGGKQDDGATGCARCRDGGVLLCGQFEGKVDFDPGRGVRQHRSKGYGDVFVSAYDENGRLHWTRTFGGEGSEQARDMAIDAEGNIIVVGAFAYTVDFNPVRGRAWHTSAGLDDIFVVKLNPSGLYLWSRTIGGRSDESAFGVAVDDEGDVTVTGGFRGTVDFDPGEGVDTHRSLGDSDAFITRFGADGSYRWTHSYGTSQGSQRGNAVVTDEAGNAYVTGSFGSAMDFDVRGDGDVRVTQGGSDTYITSRAQDGSYRGTTVIGGPSSEVGFCLAFDRERSHLVLAGGFDGPLDFDPGEGVDERVPMSDRYDAFVTRLTTDSDYVRTDVVGGTGRELPQSLVAGPASSALLTGYFDSFDGDFDPTTGIDLHSTHGDRSDMFASMLFCGPCAVVERHLLTGKRRKIKAHVRALVPGGRVAAECIAADRPGVPIRILVDIEDDSTGAYTLERLNKGVYNCAITEVRNADGNVVCEEPAGRRVVRVK